MPAEEILGFTAHLRGFDVLDVLAEQPPGIRCAGPVWTIWSTMGMMLPSVCLIV